jgi:hypothetical protein
MAADLDSNDVPCATPGLTEFVFFIRAAAYCAALTQLCIAQPIHKSKKAERQKHISLTASHYKFNL